MAAVAVSAFESSGCWCKCCLKVENVAGVFIILSLSLVAYYCQEKKRLYWANIELALG